MLNETQAVECIQMQWRFHQARQWIERRQAVERIQMHWRIHRAKEYLKRCETDVRMIRAWYDRQAAKARAAKVILDAWRGFCLRRGSVISRALIVGERIIALLTKL